MQGDPNIRWGVDTMNKRRPRFCFVVDDMRDDEKFHEAIFLAKLVDDFEELEDEMFSEDLLKDVEYVIGFEYERRVFG